MIGRSIRKGAAPGLFDYDDRFAELTRHEDPLARLDAVVDWEKQRARSLVSSLLFLSTFRACANPV